MAADIITWPTDGGGDYDPLVVPWPYSYELQLDRSISAGYTSGGSRVTQEFGNGRWRHRLELQFVDQDAAYEFAGLMGDLGHENVLTMPIFTYEYTPAAGDASILTPAAAGAVQVSITGLSATPTRGMFFSIPHWTNRPALYRVTRVVSYGGGDAVVRIEPGLWGAVVFGTNVQQKGFRDASDRARDTVMLDAPFENPQRTDDRREYTASVELVSAGPSYTT